jgi:SSS family solute:Na+ symporter
MPTVNLGPIDLAVVIAFVVAILALGFSAKLRDSGMVQYLVAGRTLSVPAFVATLVSTWYGGILGVGESVSYYGLGTWLMFGVPYYVFALLYAIWLAPKVRGAEEISIPERIASRWGKHPGLIGAVLVFLLALPAAHVLMLGVLVQSFTGWPLPVGVLTAAVAGFCLLYRGGLLADVRMSLLAFSMMYIGFGAIAIYCLATYPIGPTMSRIENQALLRPDGGASWTMILSLFVLGAWTLVDPGFHQRVASANSPAAGRTGVFVSVGFWFLFDCLSITTALYGLALLSPPPADAKALYPALAEQVLPPGLKAVFLCGILGTIASAFVGYTLVSGATLGREVLARMWGESRDMQVKTFTRGGLVVAILLAVLLALHIRSVVDLWYAWTGAVIGPLLLPVLLAYLTAPRVQPKWVAWSMVISAGVSLAWLFYGLRTNNPFLQVFLLSDATGSRWVLPPDGANPPDGLAFSIGTLLPGLIVSATILGLGEVLARRIRT